MNARSKALNSFDGALKEIRDVSSETVNQITEQATETARQATTEVNRAVHRSPWYFVGGAAVMAAAFGFFAGRKLKF